MARQALPVQQITRAGLTPAAYVAAHVDGFAIPNDGHTFVHVKTVGTGTTMTAKMPGSFDGQTIANGGRQAVIGTNAERFFGPYPPDTYNQQGTGEVHVDFSAITAVTLAAYRLS